MQQMRNWIGLFLLGTINNLPYVIVNSAASTIADSFNETNFVGLVFGANVALSAFVKGLNTFFLLKVPFKYRFMVNGCLMLIGLIGVAYSFSFGFALACIVVVGSSAAFGENVTLGFLSQFPSKLINAWSSGTGMAGLLGSSVYIVFGCTVGNGSDKTSKLHTLTKYAFLLTTPVVLIYWVAYFVIVRVPTTPMSTLSVSEPERETVDEKTPIIQHSQTESEGETERCDPPVLEETALRRIWRCLKLVGWMAGNLAAVYVFEYVARGCAAKVRPKSEYHVGCPELYAALQLCYQAGVFVSRSSVQLVQIQRVEVLSALQFINMIIWIIDVHYKFLPVAVLPAFMVYVGLLGGASYVNIFYILLHSDRFPAKDKELCINLTALFITIGICIGTGMETALFTTLLKND
ncbi:battenin-like [Haliotis rufescens]|uniref:battenin-like n=1 Tax=Haliotis rufescens TaxID=6454 RepID=UPI00201F8586|nr:battenin-like [Haliotis rufescens]